VIRDIRRGRNATGTAFGARLAHSFVIDEEKRLIFEDGPAHRATELIQVERLLRSCGGEIEKIAGIECGVSQIVKSRAVEVVGAAFGHDIDSGAGAAPILGLKVGSNVNLSDGFDRKNGGRSAEHAALI